MSQETFDFLKASSMNLPSNIDEDLSIACSICILESSKPSSPPSTEGDGWDDSVAYDPEIVKLIETFQARNYCNNKKTKSSCSMNVQTLKASTSMLSPAKYCRRKLP